MSPRFGVNIKTSLSCHHLGNHRKKRSKCPSPSIPPVQPKNHSAKGWRGLGRSFSLFFWVSVQSLKTIRRPQEFRKGELICIGKKGWRQGANTKNCFFHSDKISRKVNNKNMEKHRFTWAIQLQKVRRNLSPSTVGHASVEFWNHFWASINLAAIALVNADPPWNESIIHAANVMIETQKHVEIINDSTTCSIYGMWKRGKRSSFTHILP